MDVTEIIDISSWNQDSANDGIYPKGALEKNIFSKPGSNPLQKYLYKKWWSKYGSDGQYMEVKKQIWNELICFRIGSELLELHIPTTYIAKYNDSIFPFGVLTKWFVEEGQTYKSGYDILNMHYGDSYSKQKLNYEDIFELCRLKNINDWFIWWLKAFLFDFIIGNTDRHFENWGILISENEDCALAPIFDNGVSFDFRELSLENYDYERSIQRFRTKIRIKRTGTPNRNFQSTFEMFYNMNPIETLTVSQQFINRLDMYKVSKILSQVKELSRQLPEEFGYDSTRESHTYRFIHSHLEYLKRTIETCQSC